MNRLYYGDNLEVLRNEIKDETVDLIYLDPPFNSQANYNVLFKAPSGEQSHAQIEAFEDTWHWGDSAEHAFDEVMKSGNTDAAELLRAMRSFLKENDMMGYLAMMAVRLIELHRVLKPSGSLYLHCDPTASHYLKVLMDAVFDPERFANEIIWKRTSAHSGAERFGPVHDVILFYTKSAGYFWGDPTIPHDPEYVATFFREIEPNTERQYQANVLTGSGVRYGDSGKPWRGIDPTAKGRHWAIPAQFLSQFKVGGTVQEKLDELDRRGRVHWPQKKDGFPRLKYYSDELGGGATISDVWTDVPHVSGKSSEKLGYPTQKPLALLERIITASSNEGDTVLDPFCGCGTAVHAAQKLKRRWIGIDITHLAISLIEKRLTDAFPGIKYEVHGTPKDLEGARDLALRDKYQFQWWAVSLVNAVPFGGKKKGADSGIDGLIYFKDFKKKDGVPTPTPITEKIIVSVKGGETVHVGMIRDLAHVVKREKAKMGLFVTLAEPTDPMNKEALKEGFFEAVNGKYRSLQIVTIKDLLESKKPELPPFDPTLFLKAKEETKEQGKLFR